MEKGHPCNHEYDTRENVGTVFNATLYLCRGHIRGYVFVHNHALATVNINTHGNAMQCNAIKQPTGGMHVLTNTSKQDDCHSYLSIGSFDSTVATKIKVKRQFLHLLLILQNSQKWWSIPVYPVNVSADNF